MNHYIYTIIVRRVLGEPIVILGCGNFTEKSFDTFVNDLTKRYRQKREYSPYLDIAVNKIIIPDDCVGGEVMEMF
jgi:hypothetical protein